MAKKFKLKDCNRCKEEFTPISGNQKHCTGCWTKSEKYLSSRRIISRGIRKMLANQVGVVTQIGQPFFTYVNSIEATVRFTLDVTK